LDGGDGRRALGHPVFISRARQRVLDHGVDGHERDAVRQFDQLVIQAAAIDLDGGVFAPENRYVLIHDAAGYADKFALGPLAELGQFERRQLAAAQESQRRGNFERRRRTEPGTFRHRAMDQNVGGLNGKARRATSRATPMG